MKTNNVGILFSLFLTGLAVAGLFVILAFNQPKPRTFPPATSYLPRTK